MKRIYVCNVSDKQPPLQRPSMAFESPPNRIGNNGTQEQPAQTTANSDQPVQPRFEGQPPLVRPKMFEDRNDK